MKYQRILLSRTDSIGDVVLTLPMAGMIKSLYPDSYIFFLGSSYTKDVVDTSVHVDEFVDWSEIQKMTYPDQLKVFKKIGVDVIVHVFPDNRIATLAKQAKIKLRVGTTGRGFHYTTCNKLIPISRRRSGLHEAQLNLKLIHFLTGMGTIPLDRVHKYYGFNNIGPLLPSVSDKLAENKFNLILHPKSKGSAREWGLKNFTNLVNLLPAKFFQIFVTGTKDEGELIRNENPGIFQDAIDLTGKLSLKELISFIHASDGLVAASTGPLHLASALGKYALGIYPPIIPMHPGRWAPVGENAAYFVVNKKCSDCRKQIHCECIESIGPEQIKEKLISSMNDKTISQNN